MARWLIEIEGEIFDLEEFTRWFPDGEIFTIQEEDKFFITGSFLEKFNDDKKVYEAGIEILDEFSAIISLLWPSLKRPSISRIIHESDEGKRQSFVFLSGTVDIRTKAHAALTVSDESNVFKGPTQAQQLLAATRMNRDLQVATLLWADPLQTWPRLYRILEEIEHYLGQSVNKAGVCSESQRKRFTRSANSAEIAGKDARHGTGKYLPPNDPMSLMEAASFIRQLLIAALQRQYNTK